MNPRIVPIGDHHEAALQAFLADFDAAGEAVIVAWFASRDWAYAEQVRKVNAWEHGEELGAGWVPCTTRFLEDDGELLGVFNLRQALTPRLERFGGHIGYSVRPSARRQGHAARLLAAALDEARRCGIERALLTCAPDNIGSVVVIERAGGVLEEESWHEGEQRLVRRYWIEV